MAPKSSDDSSVEHNYKCLIQLSNYGGLGAYVIASLISPDESYVETLSVSGDEIDWYEDLPKWWEFQKETIEDIDGITGASIKSGDRRVVTFQLDPILMNKGYKLRLESAVEDKPYYEKDIELHLTDSIFGKNIEGQGYIRYIKIIKR